MLTIHLKTGGEIIVPNFKKVSYWSSGTLKEKRTEQFNELSINSNSTYNFQGDIQISIPGSEIMYLEIEEV